jgi:hypothetical protein
MVSRISLSQIEKFIIFMINLKVRAVIFHNFGKSINLFH